MHDDMSTTSKPSMALPELSFARLPVWVSTVVLSEVTE